MTSIKNSKLIYKGVMVSKPTMNTNTNVKGVVENYMKVCLFLLTGLSLTHH